MYSGFDGVPMRVPTEILAMGPDFTFAREGTRFGMPLSGMIDQSMAAANMYGIGPWTLHQSPYGGDLDAKYDKSGTYAPPSGLGSLLNQPAPQQYSSGFMQLLSNIVPGRQVPGGGIRQWFNGGQ